MATGPLDRISESPGFRAAHAPYLVLDSNLLIRAANPAYSDATLVAATDLDHAYLFDAFPDNPATPDAHSVANLEASLERALSGGRPDYMGLQRYDVPRPGDRTRFVRKVWVPVNAPLHDSDGHTIGVLHHVDDVTDLEGTGPDAGNTGTAGAERALPADRYHELVHALVRLDRAHRDAVEAQQQLHDAMSTRGVIDQAKGILIAQRGCTPDEAFALLSELSQDTNTKVHTVAKALVGDTIARARRSAGRGAGTAGRGITRARPGPHRSARGG